MTKETAVWLVVVLLVFGLGLALGRQFPAHHYQLYQDGGAVFDTTTGKACWPRPPAPEQQLVIPVCGKE